MKKTLPPVAFDGYNKATKYMIILLFILLVVFPAVKSYSQEPMFFPAKQFKNKFYIYWGWNRSWYSKSDISFQGNNYDFTLKKVVAKDRQSPFALDPYFHPLKVTIPQTNFRIGYFFKNNWNVSFGMDHMKYVVQQNQTVNITGNIQNTNSNYNGVYNNDLIKIKSGFLEFEHTDGLNYVNVEIRRLDNLVSLTLFKCANIDINIMEGFGIGALYPRTNATLLGNKRYDEFQLSGYGLGPLIGLNTTFFDCFFIQSELKGGFINMTDIRTTENNSDRAKQHFFFLQSNFIVGANFKFKNRKTIVNKN